MFTLINHLDLVCMPQGVWENIWHSKQRPFLLLVPLSAVCVVHYSFLCDLAFSICLMYIGWIMKKEHCGDVQNIVLFPFPFMHPFLSQARILQELNWPLQHPTLLLKADLRGGGQWEERQECADWDKQQIENHVWFPLRLKHLLQRHRSSAVVMSYKDIWRAYGICRAGWTSVAERIQLERKGGNDRPFCTAIKMMIMMILVNLHPLESAVIAQFKWQLEI